MAMGLPLGCESRGRRSADLFRRAFGTFLPWPVAKEIKSSQISICFTSAKFAGQNKVARKYAVDAVLENLTDLKASQSP